ncbi:MAG: prolyl oligopeptidase family serine peptidase [Acidobacteriota bacterium]|nr:prolyl oligopeptidase family serine peptidase [Acidobacteriota bacterium]
MIRRGWVHLSFAVLFLFAGTGAVFAADVTVDRWLVLGPVADRLPAFHDEKPGGYSLDDLLAADRLPRDIETPAEGQIAPWFSEGGELAWAPQRETGADGRLTLAVPSGTGEGVSAVAWLATYLETDRWQSFTLELDGAHPRRVWLDHTEIAESASAGDGVTGTLTLTPGKHLLVVATLYDPGREEDWWVEASLTRAEGSPDATLTVTLDPKRGIDIIDILDAPRITGAAISSDGTLAASVFSRIIPGTSETERWIEVRTIKDRRLRWSMRGVNARSLAFVPDAHRISYITMDDQDDVSTGTIWLADIGTGKVDPFLTGITNLEGYLWSPTGDSIVYSAAVDAEEDERGVKRLEGLHDRRSGYRRKSYLYQATVPGGATRRLTAGKVSTGALDISRDGKRLLFSRVFDDPAERPFRRNEIWEMDLDTIEKRLLREARWFNGAVYSPDGKKILGLAGPSGFDGAGINVPEGATPNDYDGQLYIWDPATDAVEPISRDFDPAIFRAVWSPKDGNIYCLARDRDFSYVFRYDFKKKAFQKIKGRFESLDLLTVASDATVALATGSSPWITQGMVAIQLNKDEAAVIKWGAGDWYQDTVRGSTRVWSFTASGGQKIDGRLYLPPGFDETRKYPCIVYYYGGVNPTGRGFGGRYPKEYWASQGYVVYVLQPSGATGYGQAFSSRHVNDWGEIVAGEIVDGVKKFLEAHPFVDPERVGCIGASYGGFMTMRLVTRTDIFAAAVSHAGISSIASYWGEGYWGYEYSAIATAESFPWNRKDLYLDQSPLFEADKVKTPILLTHGTADTNVPVGESDQFYTALKLVDAPVEYVQIEGQDHWILDHDKRLVWSQTIVAWFDRWLKDQPEWWNHLYPEP